MWLLFSGGKRGLELSGHVPALLPEDTSHRDAVGTRDDSFCTPYATDLGQGLGLSSLTQRSMGGATSGAWVWAGSEEV